MRPRSASEYTATAADAELAERPEDPDGDLAAVRDEHFGEGCHVLRVFSPKDDRPRSVDARTGSGGSRRRRPLRVEFPESRLLGDGRLRRRDGDRSGRRLARPPLEPDLGLRLAARPDRGQGARDGGARDADRRGRRPGLDGRRDHRPRVPRLRAPPGSDRAWHRHRGPRSRQAEDVGAGGGRRRRWHGRGRRLEQRRRVVGAARRRRADLDLRARLRARGAAAAAGRTAPRPSGQRPATRPGVGPCPVSARPSRCLVLARCDAASTASCTPRGAIGLAFPAGRTSSARPVRSIAASAASDAPDRPGPRSGTSSISI